MRRARGAVRQLCDAREMADDDIIVAVVPHDPHEFCEEILEEFCQKEMPEYMRPHRIWRLDAFPLTSSGKPDRGRIQQLYVEPIKALEPLLEPQERLDRLDRRDVQAIRAEARRFVVREPVRRPRGRSDAGAQARDGRTKGAVAPVHADRRADGHAARDCRRSSRRSTACRFDLEDVVMTSGGMAGAERRIPSALRTRG